MLPARMLFGKGLTTGLCAPSRKGVRLILLHAGSQDGFVNGACLVFQAAKGAGDYHKEMDGPRFEKRFSQQLLPNIKPCSVIVIDNAPYYSVHLEKVPTASTRKVDIQSWLTEKGVAFSQDKLKPELLELVNQHKMFSAYRVDVVAKAAGHCELNLIELIWSQVKGLVANNTTFTLAAVKKLLQENINVVTADKRLRACSLVQGSKRNSGSVTTSLTQALTGLKFHYKQQSDTSSESDASDSEMNGMEEPL